jgi:molybdenum cofactor biosynthesis enzyme MoaA
MYIIKYLRISITDDCNENCWYCFNEGLDKGKKILSDLESFEWLLSKIAGRYQVEIV